MGQCKELVEQEKSKKEICSSRLANTKGSPQDAEFALEHEDLSPGRRKELEEKNRHRRQDIWGKTKELREEE